MMGDAYKGNYSSRGTRLSPENADEVWCSGFVYLKFMMSSPEKWENILQAIRIQCAVSSIRADQFRSLRSWVSTSKETIPGSN